jgi:anti-anti-sigma factor
MSKDQLEYSFQPTSNPRCTVLTLQGGLTLSHIFDLQNQLRDLDADLLILDCTALEYMDSAGLGVVVNFYVSQSNQGRKVALLGISDRVWALFTSTRVDQFFPRFDSLQAAESSL